MIAHVRQTDPRGYAAMPRCTGQQCGFRHAITFPGRQRMTAAQGLRITAEGIGVVAHCLSHRVIEMDRLLERVATGTAVFFGELHHTGVVTIDEAAGAQVLVHAGNLLEKSRVYREVQHRDNDVSAKHGRFAARSMNDFSRSVAPKAYTIIQGFPRFQSPRSDHPVLRMPSKL
ncbi:hypothetical protein D3C81_1789900 [compost metagenome]